MATSQVNGEWQNLTPRSFKIPQPINTKFETGDNIHKMTPCAKFCANSSIGGFLAKGWNITKIFLVLYIVITVFVDQPTGQTTRHIYTHNGSHDVASPKGVPFLESQNLKSVSPEKSPRRRELGQKWTLKFSAKNAKDCIKISPVNVL